MPAARSPSNGHQKPVIWPTPRPGFIKAKLIIELAVLGSWLVSSIRPAHQLCMSIEIAELPGTRRRGAEADQVLSTTELGREVNVGGSAGLRLHKLFLRPGIQAPGESLVIRPILVCTTEPVAWD